MHKAVRALFVEYCEDYSAGGAQRVFADIINNINPDKIDIFVALPNPQSGEIACSLSRYIRKYEYNPRVPKRKHRRLFSYLNYAFHVPFTVLIYTWIVWRQRIDIIYTHSVISGFHFGLVSLITGCPIIYHEHNMVDQRPKQRVWEKAFYYLCRRAICVIAISEDVKKSLNEYGVPNDKITVIHNGIVFKGYSNNQIENLKTIGRSRLGLPNDCLVVGMVGHFRRWKGQHILLETLPGVVKKNEKVMYVFVGGGHEEGYLEENIHYVNERQLNEYVIFTGYQNNTEELIAAFDLVALTSNPEPFGLVLLEAMSLCKPVIAFNVGGPAEIIDDGKSGLLIPPGDVRLFEESINMLLCDANKRKEMGYVGWVRAKQKFSLRNQSTQIEQLLFKLTAS